MSTSAQYAKQSETFMIILNVEEFCSYSYMACNNLLACKLWDKVEIRNFHCHKNVNSCNNFVGLTFANYLKSKIWKVYGNIFFLYPLISVKNTPNEKKYKIFFS